MKGKRELGKFILVGIGVAALYWVFESAVMTLIFNKGSFVEQMFTPDAHELWMRSVGVGIIIAFAVYAQSVMARRKQVEQALRESGEKYRAIFNGAYDGIVLVDSETGRIVDCNPQFESQTGRQLEQLKKMKIWEIRPPEKIEPAKIKFLEVKKAGMGGSSELEFQKANGEIVSIEFVTRSTRIQGREYLQSIARDITKRKRMEEKLRFSDAAFRSIQESVVATDTEYTITHWNEVSERIYGIKASEAIGKKLFDVIEIAETSPGETAERVKKLETQGYYRDEVLHRTKCAEVWVDASVQAIEHNEKRYGWVALATDITERKQAEKELWISQEKLSSFMESAPDGFALFDSGFNYIDINRITQQMIGLNKEKIIGKNILDIIPNLKQTGRYDKYMKVIKTGKPLFIDEITPHSEFGNICLAVRAFKVGDGLGIIFTDITERKQAEDVLRQSEKKYRSLVNNVKLGIFRSTSGINGRFLEVNPATEEITGYSREELLQMNVSDLYVHPEERETVLKEAALTKGKTTRELYFRKKDGTIIVVADIKVAVRDGEDSILFFDGILEDITKRKRMEEELKSSHKELRDLSTHLQSTREEERKRLARKLHDEMGQELIAQRIDLSLLAEEFSEGQELLLDKTKSMIKRVDMIMETVEQISTELRPLLLDDLGLATAIEWQAEKFQKVTGIKCELILNQKNITLDEEHSTAIFRIFQEILSNVARYAQATKVTIDLKERANKLVLKVSDDGKGITEKEISHPKSFGLTGIRERVRSLEGEVKFFGAQNEGTTITVSIPLKREKLDAENPHR